MTKFDQLLDKLISTAEQLGVVQNALNQTVIREHTMKHRLEDALAENTKLKARMEAMATQGGAK